MISDLQKNGQLNSFWKLLMNFKGVSWQFSSSALFLEQKI